LKKLSDKYKALKYEKKEMGEKYNDYNRLSRKLMELAFDNKALKERNESL